MPSYGLGRPALANTHPLCKGMETTPSFVFKSRAIATEVDTHNTTNKNAMFFIRLTVVFSFEIAAVNWTNGSSRSQS